MPNSQSRGNQKASTTLPGELSIKSSFNLFLLAGSIFLASQSAQAGAVTIVEFSDFQCPFCGRAAPTLAQIQTDYGSQVQLEFKNFPLSFHAEARSAAMAGLCAKEQNQFKGMHDLLYADQLQVGAGEYINDAKLLGLNLDQFTKCLTSETAEAALRADLVDAALFHVNSTPTFFLISDSKVVKMVGALPYASFKTQIDLLLAPLATQAPSSR